MEAAGLYTFALARDKRLDCLAHRDEPDERRGRGLREGPADGPTAAPEVVAAAACILLPREGAGKPSKPSKPRESEP